MKKTTPILLILFSLAACKKDLRTKIYPLTTYRNSGVFGKLTLVETLDSSTITVRVEADGLRPNVLYPTYLYQGVIDSITDTLLVFPSFMSGTHNIYREQAWSIRFDDALKSNACFVMHDTIQPRLYVDSGYVMAGNIGKNGK